MSGVTHLVVDLLFANMYVTASTVAKKLRVTPLSARASITDLEKRGILEEITGRKSGWIHAAREIVHIVDRPHAKQVGP